MTSRSISSKFFSENNLKLLLVDDEKEFVQTLAERLKVRGFHPAIAFNGEDALSIVANEAPDIMVLDLKMPGMDGLEVLRNVMQEHPRVRVIILTGHGSKKEQALANELGASSYLQKPVDIDVLVSCMRELRGDG